MKRQRKEEKLRKREEKAGRRKKTKQGVKTMEFEDDDVDVDSDVDEPILENNHRTTTMNDIPSSYQPSLSQEIPLHHSSSGKPSRKSRKQNNLEIPTTQELQSPAPESRHQSSPEGTPLPEPKRRSLLSVNKNGTQRKSKRSTRPPADDPASAPENDADFEIHETAAHLAQVDNAPSVEDDEETRNTRQQTPDPSADRGIDTETLSQARKSPSTPRAKRKRQVSAQRIYDSSADEEQPLTITTTLKKRKVGDLVKYHKRTPSDGAGGIESDEKEEDGNRRREFTSEEDDHLKQVVLQYKEVSPTSILRNSSVLTCV